MAYQAGNPYDPPYPKDQSNIPPYPPPNYQPYGNPNQQQQQGGYQPFNNSNPQGYQAPPPPTSGNAFPGDDPAFGNMRSFSERAIRHAFIRKVYGILTAQLAVTCAIICVFIFVQPVKGFFEANSWLLWVVLFFTFALVCAMACFDNLRRKYPWNMILLFSFTILESILLGVISASISDKATKSGSSSNPVLIAAGITAVVVIAITIFAFQTKIDFTGIGIYLFVGLLLLMLFGFLCAIIRNDIMRLVYGALGAGLFSFYLIFDTQLMIGGKHKYSISPEEHVLAALNLYLDIINLFLMILRLVNGSRD